jgi:hypothetical protein
MIRFRSAAEMLDTFGMQQGGTHYRRLVAAFQRIFGPQAKESRAVSETGLSASMIHTPRSATREKEHKDWRRIQLWLDDGGSHFCAPVLLPMELPIRSSQVDPLSDTRCL